MNRALAGHPSDTENVAADAPGRLAPGRILRWALGIWLALLLWWVALLPGGFSPDSLDSWGQIRTGHWSSQHPPPFTAFVWLTSFGGHVAATTALSQTMLLAGALAWFAVVADRVLGTGRAVWITAVFLSLLPLVGPFSVTIWKDVPETAALVVLAGLLLLAAAGPPVRRRWWVAVALSALVVGLMRWNGGATAVVAAVVVAVAVPGRRRWAAAAVPAVAGLAGFGILLLIPQVFAVKPVQQIDLKAEQLADLAQFARNTPQAFSAGDRRVMERVAPMAQWASAGSNCLSIDPVVSGLILHHHRVAAFDADAAALSAVWGRVARKEVDELLHARACRASLAWELADPPHHVVLTTWPTVDRNRYGLHQSAPRQLRAAARRIIADVSQHRFTQALLWRPALWILLTVAAALLTGLRRARWRLLVLATATPLGVLVSYAAEPAAQDARYAYPATVLCQLAAVGYVAAWWRGRDAKLARASASAPVTFKEQS